MRKRIKQRKKEQKWKYVRKNVKQSIIRSKHCTVDDPPVSVTGKKSSRKNLSKDCDRSNSEIMWDSIIAKDGKPME